VSEEYNTFLALNHPLEAKQLNRRGECWYNMIHLLSNKKHTAKMLSLNRHHHHHHSHDIEMAALKGTVLNPKNNNNNNNNNNGIDGEVGLKQQQVQATQGLEDQDGDDDDDDQPIVPRTKSEIQLVTFKQAVNTASLKRRTIIQRLKIHPYFFHYHDRHHHHSSRSLSSDKKKKIMMIQKQQQQQQIGSLVAVKSDVLATLQYSKGSDVLQENDMTKVNQLTTSPFKHRVTFASTNNNNNNNNSSSALMNHSTTFITPHSTEVSEENEKLKEEIGFIHQM
jgi:hypothetical protein